MTKELPAARSLAAERGIYPRRYGKLFMQHIKQADEGMRLDFLRVPLPS